MYYRLFVEPGLACGYIESVENSSFVPFLLLTGERLDDDETRQIYRFVLSHKTPPALAMLDFYPDNHLMSGRLVQALLSSGISNLQIIPAEILLAESGEVLRDYSVVNIVGLVSCAVVADSDSSPLAEGFFFHKLKIDETRAGDAAMFRLEESRDDVVVSERIAGLLTAEGFVGLFLEPVS